MHDRHHMSLTLPERRTVVQSSPFCALTARRPSGSAPAREHSNVRPRRRSPPPCAETPRAHAPGSAAGSGSGCSPARRRPPPAPLHRSAARMLWKCSPARKEAMLTCCGEVCEQGLDGLWQRLELLRGESAHGDAVLRKSSKRPSRERVAIGVRFQRFDSSWMFQKVSQSYSPRRVPGLPNSLTLSHQGAQRLTTAMRCRPEGLCMA